MKKEITFHVSDLSCIRQRKMIFANISFELKEGEILLIQGPNGSGKSSLLRLLAGLATPHSGEMYFQGKSIKNSSDYFDNLHYISHLNGIKLGLTIEENLQLTHYYSLNSITKLSSILSLLQLDHIKDKQANCLSAGQKRRIAIAKLFLLPKTLWILDEPLTALDADTQTLLLTQVEQHVENGGMVIMSSHQPLEFKTLLNHKTLRLTSC